MIHYTDEQRAFLKEFIPGHHYKEIIEAFNDRWPEQNFNENHLKSFTANNKVFTGFNGRFPKGHTPPNKGKKGYCAPGCEKGWFKKGNVSINHKPVGTISIRWGQKHRKNGKPAEVFIKVAEPNKWRLYGRYLWEQTYGPIPKGYIVAFKDGDSTNVKIENLRLISRQTLLAMNHQGLNIKGEARDVGITISELNVLIRGKKNDT